MSQPPKKRRPPVTVSPTTKFSATDQFLALLMSSHHRCGARSPAAQVCSLGCLMHQMWCDWVLATSTTVVLVIEPEGFLTGDSPVSVSFAVSRTMGFSTRGEVVVDLASGRPWVTPNVSLSTRYGMFGCTALWISRRRMGCAQGSDEFESPVQMCRSLFVADAINSKWCIVSSCEVPGAIPGASANLNAVSMTISYIKDYTAYMVGEDGITSVSVMMPPNDGGETITTRLFLNKLVPDEALICSSREMSTAVTFILFDVQKTFQTKKLSVLVSTVTRATTVLFHVALVMRKSTSPAVFVVLSASYFTVLHVNPSTGKSTKISSTCSDLSQLSESVFCIGRAGEMSYELWDCYNTDRPLRNVRSSDHFNQVLCGGGFLFAVRRSEKKIIVFEASSGRVVVTLDVWILAPKGYSIAPSYEQ
ncbi:hypothetical protein Pelo_16253 [Pelomyxa schiedti]|nr:hypothetical protein Pelo_16253 [Pelomyxa schiedti]